MSLRKITSLTTLLSFILLLLTSMVLYITPQGRIAYWANWECAGIGKEEWSALHTNIGILFLIAGLLHTAINLKPLIHYLKNKENKFRLFTANFNVALIITLFVTVFSLFSLPPLNAIQTLNHTIKKEAANKYGEPPYGHAEVSTLATFCRRTGLDVDDSIKKLNKAELQIISEKETLSEIAKKNNLTPQQVYELIKPEEKEMGTKPFPSKPTFGFGRKNFGRYCADYQLDPEVISKRLQIIGIEAHAKDSIKEIAERNETDPAAIFEAMRQAQK